MIHRFAVVGSTQDLAHELAERGAPVGTVVVGGHQRKGRGTRGRAWDSGPGGLWLSLILRPPARTTEALSVRIGLELAEALSEQVTPERVDLKWPNDLIARDRKLGGILVEARWSGPEPTWVVVGVGLNVSNETRDALADTAIRLADLTPKPVLASVESVVLDAVGRAAACGGPLSPAELARFARHDWLRGRAVAAPVAGVASGLSEDGRLLVTGPDGETRAVADPVSVVGLAAAAGGA